MQSQPINWKLVKKIFILNLVPNTLGDVLLVSAMFPFMKEKAPRAQIVLTCSPPFSHLFVNNPHVEKIYNIPELPYLGKSLSRLQKTIYYIRAFFRAIRIIKKEKPDVCYVLQPNFFPSHLIPFVAGVRFRVGYTYKTSYFSSALTHTAPFRGLAEKNDYYYHIVRPKLDLLEVSGVPAPFAKAQSRKYLSSDEKAFARKYLKKIGVSENQTILGCQPGAKWLSKQWPPENFHAVLKKLLNKNKQLHVLLFGIPVERPLLLEIAQDLQRVHPVTDCNLSQVSALIARCKCFLSNDSGLGHLASSVGISTAVLNGSSIPEESKPIGAGNVYSIRGDTFVDPPIVIPTTPADSAEGVRRMRTIPVERVVAVLDEILSKTSKRNQ